MIVELKVKLDSGEYQTLDTYGNENVSLTFQIDDIRDVSSKNASYSKDFNLPATKNNNEYFNHFYDVDRYNNESSLLAGVVIGFNPYKNKRCILIVDGITILEGFLALNHSLNKQTEISYKVTIFNNVANLMDILGDATMNDIDWSYLNHERSWGNVYASFLGVNQSNVEVDYTYQYFNFTDVQYGQGYIPYQKNLNYVLCLKLKAVIDKIMQYAGFNYVSDLFSTDEFKRLYFDTVMLQEVAPPRTITAQLSSGLADGLPYYAKISPFESVGEVGQVFPFTNQSPHKFQWGIETGDTLNEVDEYGTITLTEAAQVFIKVDLKLLSAPQTLGGGFTENGVVSMFVNGVVADSVNIDASTFNGAGNPATATAFQYHTFTHSGFYDAGDVIEVTFGSSFNPSYTQFSNSAGNVGGWYYGFGVDNLLSEFRYYIAPSTPESNILGNLGSIKLSDILKDVITMFNLNVTQQDGNTILFQPYSDFVSQDFIDWTDKVDTNEEEISVVEIPKEINFKFAEDSNDHYHNIYESQNGMRYGNHKIIYNTDNTEVVDIELKVFAAPLCRTLSNVAVNSQHMGELKDDVMTTFKNKPRIVYRVGSYNPAISYPISPVWLLDSNDAAWNPDIGDQRYAYNGMTHFTDILSNVNADDFSFLFGLVNTVGMSDLSLQPTNNFFTKYWFAYIQERYNENAILLRMKAKLTPTDILNLDFSKKYKINQQEYRLNKVDYNTDRNKLTSVELIRV